MANENYLEKDVFIEHSRFMERFLAKMDEDRKEASQERKLAEARLNENRKESERRLEAEERRLSEQRKESERRLEVAEARLSEERKEAEARLEAERKGSKHLFITTVSTIIISFITIFATIFFKG